MTLTMDDERAAREVARFNGFSDAEATQPGRF
jgi:hypothetical protein